MRTVLLVSSEDFVSALVEAVGRSGLSQAAIARRVSEAEGRGSAYHQTTVSDWVKGVTTPSPAAVCALEQVLDLAPGALTLHLGYLPPYARGEVVTVPDAIDADPRLTPMGRRVLKRAYAAAVEEDG